MKANKLLSAILAVAMILGTMNIAVFAGNTDVASIGDQYYSSLEDALKDAAASAEETVTINVLEDVNNIPAPTRGGLVFKAAQGVKVTSRVNPPRLTPVTGVVTYEGFDFTTYDTGNGLFAAFDGGHQLAGLEVVFKDCAFGGEKSIGFSWGVNSNMEKLTIDNCTISVPDAARYFTLGYIDNVEIKNCDFSNHTAGNSIIQCSTTSYNVTVTNCNFGKGYINYAPNVGANARNLIVDGCTFDGNVAVNVHSNTTNAGVMFETLSITDNTFGDDTAVMTFPANVDVETYLSGNAETIMFAGNETANGEAVTELSNGFAPAAPAAKIGDAYYMVLADAFEAAESGDVVDLLGNTIVIKDIPAATPATWFDVNGKSISIVNGTFDLTGANVGDSVFRMTDAYTNLVFENVNFVKGADGYFCYFINLHNVDTTATFIDCEFDLNDGYSSFIANTSGGQIYVTDSVISNVGGNFIYRGGATITDSEYAGEDDRIIHACAYPTVIDNTDVVTDAICVIAANGTIEIINGSTVEATDVYNYHANTEPEYTTDHITVDATSSLIAENIDMDLINDATVGEVVSKADTVELVFVEDTTAELDNSVWDIVLVGSDAEIINRLNSADFTFELVAEDEMAYEIAETNAEVDINNVNNDSNRYEFHYKGKTDVETDTANRIKLGTVTFTGYGKFNFTVKAVETNAVHATTLNDNIVDTFTAAAGTLVVNNADEDADGDDDFGTIGSEIVAPTSDLIINIDFPNAVENKIAAYQKMTVTVTGEDIKDIVFDLGSDMVMPTVDQDNKSGEVYKAEFVNGGYVITIKNALTQNTAYDIKVEGAGYRTARYTVNTQETASKTVNFWNNVKDANADVEAGKFQAKKNFLAGDIVKDNNINVYDLSAVVSYFGETGLVGTNNAYAKYDLNRDGFIDSKDVAMVLVSWDN